MPRWLVPLATLTIVAVVIVAAIAEAWAVVITGSSLLTVVVLLGVVLPLMTGPIEFQAGKTVRFKGVLRGDDPPTQQQQTLPQSPPPPPALPETTEPDEDQ